MDALNQNSVEKTLVIPLWSRAIAVRKLPQILPDHDAVRILNEMGETKPPSVLYELECAALAGAIRQYDLAYEIKEYLKQYPEAVIVELGAGLSCLRRQMGNISNPWINIDLPDVIRCREQYIPAGELERNLAYDLRDHGWMDRIPFEKGKGVIFLAAGVLHYLEAEEVKSMVREMAERFAGGVLVFDYVSRKGKKAGDAQIGMTGNNTKILFTLEDAEKEVPAWSELITSVTQKNYMDGYPVPGARYSLLTRIYIRMKRKQYLVARCEFKKE